MVENTMPETEQSRAYRLRWWALLVIALTALLASLNGTMLNVALPTIQSKLNATSGQLQWMTNIYMVILGGLVLTLGALSDRLGRAKFLRLGIIIVALASLGAMFSTSGNHLIIARAVMAVGAGIILPCTLSIPTITFPMKERSLAIGVIAGLSGLSMALGPLIAGTILVHLGWKWIFAINIPMAVLALTLSLFFLTESRDLHPQRLDVAGNVLFFSGMMLLIYGLNQASSRSWSDSIVLGTVIGSLVVITLFVLWERRAMQPLLDLNFFKNIRFSTSLALLCIWSFGFMGIMYLLTFYMQFVKGWDAFQTGVRYLPIAVGFLVGAVISTRLVELLGRKIIILMGLLGGFALLLLTIYVTAATSFWYFGPLLAFLGLFMGAVSATVINMLLGSLPEEKAGISSALNTVSLYAAGSVGIAVLGSIVTNIYSSHFLKEVTALQGLPADLIHKASDSVGMAVGIANSGMIPTEQATIIVEAARQSFIDGWQIAFIILCVVFAVGVAFCLKFVPGRDA